jgi:two-component sensor histidine kinase
VQDFKISDISAQEIVDTVRSGLMVLDRNLGIMSVNRCFYSIFKTSEAETIGRKLYDLGNGQWDIPELRRLLEQIIPQASIVEGFEIEHEFPEIGRKFMSLNARKVYRDGDNGEFFLLAIEDVTEARLQQVEAERTWRLAQTIVDTVRDPLVILEGDMTIVTASRAFLDLFDMSAEQVIGKKLQGLSQGQWNVEAFQKLLARVVPDDAPISDYLLEDEFRGLGRRVFKINARKVFTPGDHVTRLLIVFEDATDAVLLDRHRDVLAAELAHRIKNSLQIISAFVSFEIRRAAEPCIVGYQAMQARISAVAELYDVIARSSAFGPVDMPGYLSGIAGSVRSSLLGQGTDITIRASAEPLSILPDHAVPIGLIANELATNAVKYAFPSGKGEIVLGFQRRDDEVTLTVSDDGSGMASHVEGTGLGSRFINAFVKQLDGSLATATGKHGTTVTIRLPSSVLSHSKELLAD